MTSTKYTPPRWSLATHVIRDENDDVVFHLGRYNFGEGRDKKLDAEIRLALSASEMYRVLKRLGCFCEHGIGNPMVSSHSDLCKRATEVVKFVEEGTINMLERAELESAI